MAANDPNYIEVEVAFATPQSQSLCRLSLDAGATVDDAIHAAQLQASFPEYRIADLATGIWGKLAAREQRLKSGDRVEVYRELERDPMEARRIRALGSVPGPSGSR